MYLERDLKRNPRVKGNWIWNWGVKRYKVNEKKVHAHFDLNLANGFHEKLILLVGLCRWIEYRSHQRIKWSSSKEITNRQWTKCTQRDRKKKRKWVWVDVKECSKQINLFCANSNVLQPVALWNSLHAARIVSTLEFVFFYPTVLLVHENICFVTKLRIHTDQKSTNNEIDYIHSFVQSVDSLLFVGYWEKKQLLYCRIELLYGWIFTKFRESIYSIHKMRTNH